MPPNTPTTEPLTWTATTGNTYTFTGAITNTVSWPEPLTEAAIAYPPPPPRRARSPRARAELFAAVAALPTKNKFTWALWSNMWGKIAEAHEKRVYLIPDEPPTPVTSPISEPVVAPTTAPRVNRYAAYYDEDSSFYDAPF